MSPGERWSTICRRSDRRICEKTALPLWAGPFCSKFALNLRFFCACGGPVFGTLNPEQTKGRDDMNIYPPQNPMIPRGIQNQGIQEPYRSRISSAQAFSAPRYEIIRVNGEQGARAFQAAPNSTALLLDDTAPIVWFVQTDGVGYHDPVPYQITPYKPEPPVDVRLLDTRLKKLEELIHESHSTANEPTAASTTSE